MFTATDAHWMAQALRLAERGLLTVRPNPAVGCVIVKDGQLIGQGWHQRAGEPHAEVYALREAGEQARGATAYVTLEPCSHHGRTPPCSDALISMGVARVVVAMQDPNPQVAGKGLARLRNAGIAVSVGLMGDSARRLNLGFFSRVERQRPYVRVKIAASLDGRTALHNGQSQWITSEAARADVQHLRAQSGAIVTGIQTILMDDPLLNVRLSGFSINQPMLVVLDSHLQMPLSGRCWQQPERLMIVCAASTLDSELGRIKQQQLVAQGAQVLSMAEANGRVDLQVLWHYLAQTHQINDMLVEAGATLAGAVVQSGLVDEVIWYAAPCILGNTARAGLVLPPIEQMQDVIRWSVVDERQVGRDWRLTFKVN